MAPPDRHVVVFDVNIFLDVASLLEEPFTWQKFNDRTIQVGPLPVPQPDRRIDSLRALSLCQTGTFAAPHTLEVWTSAHIDTLVRHKAEQPDDPWLDPEDRGLGWTATNADDLLKDLVYQTVTNSGGNTVGTLNIPYGNPPLSHEDGLVYRTAHQAANGDTDIERWCVTHDKGFLTAAPSLPGYARVITAAKFVEVIRRARTAGHKFPGAPPSPRI